MDKDQLLKALTDEIANYNTIVATGKGDWIVKGFIDTYKNIYTITIDTKVVSKVMELLLIPHLFAFAERNNLDLHLPAQQNFYPDLTFICKKTGNKFAVDIKSTFKDSREKIKSMTLGAFTGYFRDRKSTKNTTFPYGEYNAHLVLGVIYSQIAKKPDEKTKFTLDEIDKIESVIRDFQFFVQPKYKIASARPGSGNTKNIGSTNIISKLINGQGVFEKLGEEIYDDYWMNYLTIDMARAAETQRPYKNLEEYLERSSKQAELFSSHLDLIKEVIAQDKEETTEIKKQEANEQEGDSTAD